VRGCAILATLLLTGCEDGGEALGNRVENERLLDQGGRVADLADALTPPEELALARRLAYQQQADGRSVMVVILEAGRGQSLEQIGWAVGAGAPPSSFLLLVDPAQRRVRVEGDLQPDGRAQVAGAMQAELAAGRVAAAVDKGLLRLEQLAP
jgi:uncharacterized membrane protein YgcG